MPNRPVMALATLALCAPGFAAEPCDPQQGAQPFADKCAICHMREPGAIHTVGPNLYRVLGRGIGKAEGFTYSAALAQAEGAWSEARLDAFMKSPQSSFPGTAMPFAGLRSDKERKALVCFLAQP